MDGTWDDPSIRQTERGDEWAEPGAYFWLSRTCVDPLDTQLHGQPFAHSDIKSAGFGLFPLHDKLTVLQGNIQLTVI